MDQETLQHPFVLGTLVGLLACLVVWVRAYLAQRALHREIEDLKRSLFTKFKIDTKAQVQVDAELEALRRQNENLRVTVAGLQQKPGRAELRHLQVVDRALHMMLASAPGFAPAWEEVLKQSEREMRETETGLGSFIRKTFVTQLPAVKAPPVIEAEASMRSKDGRSS
ncbi:MAG: hypothetical protein ABW252_25425 [Polyangiales bacterium]